MSGKIAIVTGANAGIGFETTRSLVRHGCTVIMACRNLVSAEEAIQQIKEEKPAVVENCVVIFLDLTVLPSVVSVFYKMENIYKLLFDSCYF